MASIILKFDVGNTNSAKEFNFFDTTGDQLPGGYGAGGNLPYTNFLEDWIEIYQYPSGDTFTVNVYSASIPFPNVSDIPRVILNTDLGLSEDAPIPSAIYHILYHIQGSAIYETDHYVYLDYNHQCCSDKMLAKAIKSCDEAMRMRAISLQAKIDSVHAMLEPNCLDVVGANDLVKEINKICQCGQSGRCGGCS